MSHPPGKGHSSRCFRRQRQLNPCLISGPLQTYVCCANSLHTSVGTNGRRTGGKSTGRATWFLAGKTNWRTSFDCQPVFAKNPGCKYTTLDHQLGSFQSIWQSWLECTMDRTTTTWYLGAFDLDIAMRILGATGQAWSENMTLIAVDSMFAVVYVKDVYLAHVYLVRCWRWPCLHGVRKWKLKDCPLKMASSLCWMYDLPMT